MGYEFKSDYVKKLKEISEYLLSEITKTNSDILSHIIGLNQLFNMQIIDYDESEQYFRNILKDNDLNFFEVYNNVRGLKMIERENKDEIESIINKYINQESGVNILKENDSDSLYSTFLYVSLLREF